MGSTSALAKVISDEPVIPELLGRANAAVRDQIHDKIPGDTALPEGTQAEPPRKVRKMSPRKIEQLVLDHREHGKRLAWSFLSSWRISLHQDEVISVVGAALCEAANRFDPHRGVEFKTFFFYHLRGMLLKEISRVIQEQRVLQFVPHHVVSGGNDPESSSPQGWNAFPIVDKNNPENILEKREVATRCWEACEELDPLERDVLVRFFVYDEPLIEIAERLNYCRCHISRVKSRALEKLGRLMSEYTTAADGSIDEVKIAPVEDGSVRQLRSYTGGRGRRRPSAFKGKGAAVRRPVQRVS